MSETEQWSHRGREPTGLSPPAAQVSTRKSKGRFLLTVLVLALFFIHVIVVIVIVAIKIVTMFLIFSYDALAFCCP
jgi:heme/copper-type cytochrome/quinol oxidase subunit 2